jgi:uncharacterized membrane protein YkvA (DUF1232 family)
MKPEKKLLNYSKYYSEKRLFRKLKRFSGKISTVLLFYILILFYLVSDKSVPVKTRIIFIATLGYVIFPSDLVADILPGLGFTDDAALIAYAISSASGYITPELKEKALSTLGKLAGPEGVERIKSMKLFT